MHMRLARLASLLVFPVCLGTRAQTAEKLPTYDVATIRPSTSDSGNSSVWTHDASLTVEHVSLKALIQHAVGIPQNMIFGLPGWAESARFDINAKVIDPDMAQLGKLTPARRRAMLLALFEDRFGLKWHHETRVEPTYDLVVGKDRSRLVPTAEKGDNDSTNMNNTDLTAKDVRISALTDILTVEVGRPVVDKTGLAGRYDFHLKWTRETGPDAAEAGKDTDAPPPLFTALQEQLGLKLQAGKDPVQVVVIDRIEAPSAN